MNQKINEGTILLTISFGVLFVLVFSSFFQIQNILQVRNALASVDVREWQIPEPSITCYCKCLSFKTPTELCSNVSYVEDGFGTCLSTDYSITISAIAATCENVWGLSCSGSSWNEITRLWETFSGSLAACG